MNAQLKYSPKVFCVACLSSERQLNHLNHTKVKESFCEILNNFESITYNILLCYECLARFKNGLRFRRQVQQAHQFLTRVTKHDKKPTPLSNFVTTKPETFQWKPDPRSNQDEEKSLKYDNLSIGSDYDDVSGNFVGEIEERNSQKITNLSKFQPHEHGMSTNSNPVDIWEVKIEPVIEKTDDQIKDEPIDDGKGEESMLLKPASKYKFSDSDDEPLKVKKAKKKVKKEEKEQKRERPPGVVSGVWVQKKLQQLNVAEGQLEMVVLSWEEVESERQKLIKDATYTRHEFRCPSCVVGFNHRFKLDSHMKKHSLEAGDLECVICKTRFKTQAALLCHRRRHRSRWRCGVCGSMFSRAAVAADHVSRTHGAPAPAHACHVCGHTATSLGKLRVHLKSHSERQHCEQCGKTFRDKSSLRTHLYIHTNQMDFSCQVCDKKFRFKKALEIHSITHQASELLYCADCDMNFKNRLSFYQHINYSMKHIHPDKIKYACEFCPRRFSKPARLEEHRLSIHLKLAPHRCTVDDCAFASASRPALRTHVRMVHRNKRLERNHVCHTCGKTYTTKKILEGHIRSHTGERPFTCSKCPATFSHDAALYNHNKLVHKTPFVRRRKNGPTIETPVNWNIAIGNTEKPPTEITTPDP